MDWPYNPSSNCYCWAYCQTESYFVSVWSVVNGLSALIPPLGQLDTCTACMYSMEAICHYQWSCKTLYKHHTYLYWMETLHENWKAGYICLDINTRILHFPWTQWENKFPSPKIFNSTISKKSHNRSQEL